MFAIRSIPLSAALDLSDPLVAEAYVKESFASNPLRLRHVLIVTDRVRQSVRDLNEIYPGMSIDERLAYCAALLHDVGYLPQAQHTGFHALDGYNFLYGRGCKDLAALIVRHSTAPEEAQLRGLSLPAPKEDLIAKFITYWDMLVGPGGQSVSFAERCQEILDRYGEHSLEGRAMTAARPRLQILMSEIEDLLSGKH